jgi:hypothetical protein
LTGRPIELVTRRHVAVHSAHTLYHQLFVFGFGSVSHADRSRRGIAFERTILPDDLSDRFAFEGEKCIAICNETR